MLRYSLIAIDYEHIIHVTILATELNLIFNDPYNFILPQKKYIIGWYNLKGSPSKFHEDASESETLNTLNANVPSKQLLLPIGRYGVSVINYNHCGTNLQNAKMAPYH